MSVDPRTQSLFEAIAANNYPEVKRAIDSGVSVNSLNARDRTPLAVARFQGNLEIIELLLGAGAVMEVATVQHPPMPLVTITGDWDFQSIEYELPESPSRDRQIAYEDFVNLQPPVSSNAPVHRLVPVGGEGASRMESSPATPNLDEMTAVWQEMGADPDVTYTFDLDAVFAASEQVANKASLTDVQLFDRSEMFEEEPIITSFKQPLSTPEYEAGETYVFDLDDDLDRLTSGSLVVAEAFEEQLDHASAEWDEVQTYLIEDGSPLVSGLEPQTRIEAKEPDLFSLINSSKWGEGETYAIDLEDLGDLPSTPINPVEKTVEWAEGETYAIDLEDLGDLLSTPINPPEQKPLAEIDASFLTTLSHDKQDATGDFDLQTDTRMDRTWGVEPAKPEPIYNENASVSLMAAVIGGDLNLVQIALNEGACPDRYNWDLGYSPLGMAIMGGSSPLGDCGHLDVVRLLLEAGANPRHGSITTTALGLAAQRGEIATIELLLQREIDVNEPVGQDGWTALLVAVAHGHLPVVQLLVQHGAKVNIWSRGETPILLAAKCEQREIYQYLYPLLNATLKLSADRDGQKLLEAIQTRRSRQQNRAVEQAINMATAGKIHELNRAIESGVEINAIGSQGYTALMAAAYYGQETTIDILLRHGADLNLLSDGEDGLGDGMTALMFAASSFFPGNRQAIISKLIVAGADLDRQSPDGKTALNYAALSGAGNRHCIEKLIAAGANLNLRDRCGYTILMRLAAAENYQMFNLFLQAGAAAGGIESIQLIQAATKGHLDRVRSLVSASVVIDLDRGAALGNAVAGGYTEIVELLLRAGANPNLSSLTGFTPIESATCAGYSAIVELLITAGAKG